MTKPAQCGSSHIVCRALVHKNQSGGKAPQRQGKRWASGHHARPPTLEVRSMDLAVFFIVSRLHVARDPSLKGRERREREWRWAGERRGREGVEEEERRGEEEITGGRGGEMWLSGRTLASHATGPEFDSPHLREKKGKKNSSHFCHITFFQIFRLVRGT